MIVSNSTIPSHTAGEYVGLRLTADEFSELPDDECRYELIDGVVIMSPSPIPRHQLIASRIERLIGDFLDTEPLGFVFRETDVRFADDLVYCPEIVFFYASRVESVDHPLAGAPDLVVEVISPSSRRLDTVTKMHDYEQYGVAEYWIIDPKNKSTTFYRLEGGNFVESKPAGDRYESHVLRGFAFELPVIRAMFEMK